MTSTKKHPAPSSKHTPPVKKGGSKTLWIFGAIAVLIVVVVVATSGGGSKSGAVQTAAASPEEAKYIGRFLPAGYEEPKIGESAAISATTQMTPVVAKPAAGGISIPVSDVVSKRIVSFEYQKPGADVIPLVAYVKPSGKVFVGVSYCVPCKSTGQRFESDGTLTCEACGTKRDPETGVGISGACKLYPLDELPVTVNGGQIEIPSSALDGWTVQPLDRPVG